MKTFYPLSKVLFFVVLIVLFSRCSDELESNFNSSNSLQQKNGITISFNNIGEAYNYIYQTYQNEYQDSVVTTELIIQRVENIVLRGVVLGEVKESYPNISNEIIDSLTDDTISLEEYTINLLSFEAQSNFIPFLNSLNNKTNQDVYNTVSNFENTVMLSGTYSENDIKVMQTITTIIKAHTENGDDDDWSNQGSTVTKAALYGSAESSSKATIMAAIVRLTF